MEREIGKTGIRVYAVGLGGMPLSIQGRPDEKNGLEVVKASLEAGVNFIDTANVYCLDDNDMGHNERLIQKALELKGKRHSVIVATKAGCRRPHGDWTVDGRPEFLRESCHKSLKALNREAITLYQLHAPDPKVRLEDSVGELAKLKKEGKILHVGLSNVSLDQVKRAQKITRIESVQNRCNPFVSHDYHNGMLKYCMDQGMSYIPHSPVGGHLGHLRLLKVALLKELGEKYAASPYCVILAWHLSKGDRVIPIPGASRIQSASDSPKAVPVRLAPEDIRKIDTL